MRDIQFAKRPHGAIRLLFALLCAFFLSSSQAIAAPDGKALFSAKCATCHHPLNKSTGPALKGVTARSPGMDWIHEWVHNPPGKIASGDAYANKIYKENGQTQMTPFPELTNADIDAIIGYVETYAPPAPPGGGAPGATGAPAEDNTWLYTLITLALLAVAIILWRVNGTLRQASEEKAGVPSEKAIPLYRHKFVIAITVILGLSAAGYYITNGAVNEGRQQNYMPKQPIFYSHKVHAGINQINCLYCHAGAEKSKHAMIPSTNVCMNCHKQISTYTRADAHALEDYEGHPVDGTAEIQKLYKAAGWDPVKADYRRDAQGNIQAPGVEWTKVHNLPDHVYFNHSQHVVVGQVACQRCHGNIEEMDEVKQYAPLSMGWCINCHRQTEVKFQDNNYYSIFEKYHQEMKEGKRSGVTVEDIGGIECQKCHY